MTGARVVVVDHHDSYTWNLVHLVAAVTGSLPTVVEHDEVTLDDLAGFSHVVLSPGPGNPLEPGDFAVGREVLLSATVPVLGVCLGMQGLVTTYGGTVAASSTSRPTTKAPGSMGLPGPGESTTWLKPARSSRVTSSCSTTAGRVPVTAATRWTRFHV